MWAELETAIRALVVREVGGMVGGSCVKWVDARPVDPNCYVEAATAAFVGDFNGVVGEVGVWILEEEHDSVDPPLILFSMFPNLLHWIS